MKEWIPDVRPRDAQRRPAKESPLDTFDGWVTLSVEHERGLGGVLGLVKELHNIEGLDVRRMETDRGAGVTALKLYFRQPYPLHDLLETYPRVLSVDWPAGLPPEVAVEDPDAFTVRIAVN